VAIQCWVGPEWDTDDLVGPFQQRIANGWYTNVESSLSGYHSVEQRYVKADVPPDAHFTERVGFETYMDVSWRAEPGEVLAECEVHRVERATLRVTAVDARGRPLGETTVYGCGGSGETDAHGVATLEVQTATRCGLTAYRYGAGLQTADTCNGSVLVTPLAGGEIRDATVTLACFDILSAPILTGPPPSTRLGAPPGPRGHFLTFRTRRNSRDSESWTSTTLANRGIT
jgi:hypothetical protein